MYQASLGGNFNWEHWSWTTLDNWSSVCHANKTKSSIPRFDTGFWCSSVTRLVTIPNLMGPLFMVLYRCQFQSHDWHPTSRTLSPRDYFRHVLSPICQVCHKKRSSPLPWRICTILYYERFVLSDRCLMGVVVSWWFAEPENVLINRWCLHKRTHKHIQTNIGKRKNNRFICSKCVLDPVGAFCSSCVRFIE